VNIVALQISAGAASKGHHTGQALIEVFGTFPGSSSDANSPSDSQIYIDILPENYQHFT
jgi:hypothetical protein